MNKPKTLRKVLILTLILFVLVFVDQLTKAIAQVCLTEGDRARYITLIPGGWLGLTYSENTGMAWSNLSDNAAAMLVITYLTPVLIAVFVTLALTVFKRNTPAQVSLFVISAGALGNFIDRALFKGILASTLGKAAVRDFVDLKFFNVCNLADFCITLGAVAFIFIILFIGSSAVFPLTKKWRAQAKEEDAKK